MKNDKKTFSEPSDKNIPELIRHAINAVKMWQRNAAMKPRVIFKHTCSACGQRGFVDRPNTVPEKVTCGGCGNLEPYTKGGYSLAFELAGTSPHGDTCDKNGETVFARPTVATVEKSAPQIQPDIPVKLGCRCESSGEITPLDRDALRQFIETCGNQGMAVKS